MKNFLILLTILFYYTNIHAQLDIEHVLPWSKSNINSCKILDINDDGLNDIIVEAGSLYILENNGNGFEEEKYIGSSNTELYIDDYDKDGDLDIISLNKGKIYYHEMLDQEDINFDYSKEVELDLAEGGFGFSYLTDLDQDGDYDIVGDGLSWFENTNGILQLEDEVILHETTDDFENQRLQFCDLDNDSDIDILSFVRLNSSSQKRYQILHYENNGNEVFLEPTVLIDSFEASYLSIFIAEDIEKDGDIDLIINQSKQQVVLFRNQGDNNFGSAENITPYYDAAADTKLYDINNDGNLDIFTVGHGGIKWTLGKANGLFEDTEHILSKVSPANPSYDACFGDLDQDGDSDVFYPGISLQTIPKRISWFENEFPMVTNDSSVENLDISIYPNPAKNRIHISGDVILQSVWYNSLGQLVNSSIGNDIDVSSLRDGIYFVNFVTASNQSITKTIEIKK